MSTYRCKIFIVAVIYLLTYCKPVAAQDQLSKPANQFPYPSKPRSMWELGVYTGYSFIAGDIDSRAGFSGGLSLRAPLSHTFSLRAGYTGSFNYGLDYRPRIVAGAGSPWGPAGTMYVANYRGKIHQLNLDLIGSLNSISHYRANPATDWYVFTGYSLVVADIDIDPSTSTSASVGGRLSPGFNYLRSRKDIKADLKHLLNDYTSNAPVTNGNREPIGRHNNNQLIRHAIGFGTGVTFKLSSRFSFGLEQRFTLPFSDDLDGINAGKSNDILSNTSMRGGIALGNSQKRVASLWWINPNNYIYGELNSPKHMRLSVPVLLDSDGDGIIDQFDLEPNTPAGAPVDTHGVAKDTDGDGVPDYKDKELLTHQICFPVNIDGEGNCPEPLCCTELLGGGCTGLRIFRRIEDLGCHMGALPSIQFKKNSTTLSNEAKDSLNYIADRLNNNPICVLKVIGYSKSDKRSQQLSWERVDAVIKYLVDVEGISEQRLQFYYGEKGNTNIVDLVTTNEEGPNTVPAPYPVIKKEKLKK